MKFLCPRGWRNKDIYWRRGRATLRDHLMDLQGIFRPTHAENSSISTPECGVLHKAFFTCKNSNIQSTGCFHTKNVTCTSDLCETTFILCLRLQVISRKYRCRNWIYLSLRCRWWSILGNPVTPGPCPTQTHPSSTARLLFGSLWCTCNQGVNRSWNAELTDRFME